MKSCLRLMMVLVIVGVAVLPLSAEQKSGARATLDKGSSVDAANGFTANLICLIECSDGTRTWEEVETRGQCLDACESFCGELCELVNS